MIKWPADTLTLAIDIGGSGIKASVINKDGEMVCERIRMETPYPSHPAGFSQVVSDFVKVLPKAQRASVGFPGLVRNGIVVMVPSLSRLVKDGPKDPELVNSWKNFDLQTPMANALGIPTKVANDADIQGAAVIKGEGLEFVMTLGTDATSAFSNQHGQSAKPNRTLEGFIIGALGTTIDTLPTPQAIANNNSQNEEEEENEGDED